MWAQNLHEYINKSSLNSKAAKKISSTIMATAKRALITIVVPQAG